MTLENRLTLFAQRVAAEIDAIRGGLGSSSFVLHSATPPANPTEGMLWRELDAQGQPVEPWPWRRLGPFWASEEVQRVQRMFRDLNGNASVALDDYAPWPDRVSVLVGNVHWSLLRHRTNVAESTWRCQLVIRIVNGTNPAVDDNLNISGLSPDIPIRISNYSGFGYSNGSRLLIANVLRSTGTGQADIAMSAEFRALRPV